MEKGCLGAPREPSDPAGASRILRQLALNTGLIRRSRGTSGLS